MGSLEGSIDVSEQEAVEGNVRLGVPGEELLDRERAGIGSRAWDGLVHIDRVRDRRGKLHGVLLEHKGEEESGGDLHVPVRRVPPHRRVAGRVRLRRRVPGEDGPHPQEVRAGAELLRRVDLQRHRILERLRARDVVGHEADQSLVFPRGPAVGGEVEAHVLGGPNRANVAPVSGVPLDRDDALEPVELGVQADAADLLVPGVQRHLHRGGEARLRHVPEVVGIGHDQGPEVGPLRFDLGAGRHNSRSESVLQRLEGLLSEEVAEIRGRAVVAHDGSPFARRGHGWRASH
jgi:hypothetical protein